MNLLPHWCLTDKNPAFYDTDSKTAIEQTARIYAAMQELINEYNAFVDSVNQHITDFANAAEKDYEVFTTGIRQEFQDFIDVIELKVKAQDKAISDKFEQQDADIENAIKYMKSNLNSSITQMLEEIRENGEMTQDVLIAFNDIVESITVEETKRTAADSTLQQNINSESAARSAADSTLQQSINTLSERMNTFTTLPNGSTAGDAELADARTDYTGKTWENVGSHIRGVSNQLSLDIGNHEVTQLYNPAEWLSDGYHNYYENNLFLDTAWFGSQRFGRFIMPCASNEVYYINTNPKQIQVTFLNAEMGYVGTLTLTGNKIVIPNNDAVAFMSMPIAYHHVANFFISKTPLETGVKFIPYNETRKLRDLIRKENDFYKKANNIIKSSDGAVIVSPSLSFNGALFKADTITEENQMNKFICMPFNSTMAVMQIVTGFVSFGFGDGYALAYRISDGSLIALSLSDYTFVILKTVETPIDFYGRKIYVDISNGYFTIKDYFTGEYYVNENVESYIKEYAHTLTAGYCYFHLATYSGRYLFTVYDDTPFSGCDYINTASELTQWNGKKWFAYGTSLTSIAQGNYVPYVAGFSGLEVTNKGIGGGGLISNRNIYNAVMSDDGKANADLITLEVGANDGSSPLGTPLDTDNTTFCGSLNMCIKHLLETCPKAQIVIMDSTLSRHAVNDETDLYSIDKVTSGGYNYLERRLAIEQCAIINGVYFIPFSQLGLGIYRTQNNGLYVSDQIHHTKLGGFNLAKGVWSYLKNIPLWYTELPE